MRKGFYYANAQRADCLAATVHPGSRYPSMNQFRLRSLQDELTAARDHIKSLKIRIRKSQFQIEWSQKAIAESQQRIAELEMAVDDEKTKARAAAAPKRVP